MERRTTEKIQSIQHKFITCLAIAYISVLIFNIMWISQGNNIESEEHLDLETRGLLEIQFTEFVYYLRAFLAASVMSLLLNEFTVERFYKIFPMALKENGDNRIIIHYTVKRFNTGSNQTDTVYLKRRRRTAQKFNIIQDKTRCELKKIRRKRRRLIYKYDMKETKIRKDLRCKEVLIGELELRRAAIITHLTQLKCYVTNSRDELENQRDRNKSIPDTVDLYGNLVASSYCNVPPMVF